MIARPSALVPAATSRNPLIFVLLTVLIDTIGFGIILPVIPQLIMQIAEVDLAGAARLGGFLLVVFALLQFLCGPLIGNLSDRFGRRPVLLISLLAFGVNYALMGLAPTLGWLFVGRALTGIAGAIFGPANAFVADVTPPEKRAQSFGLIGAAFGLGFVLGPVLGGFLGELGPRAPFFAAASLAFCNFIYGFFVLPETLPRERRRPFSLARANPLGTLLAFRGEKQLLALMFAAFVWQLAFHVYPATWAYFVIAKFKLTPAAIGGTLALSGLSMGLVAGFLTGRIVAKLGETRAAPLGVFVGMSAFLSYAFMNESWMLYPTLLLGGLQGIAMPAMNASMSKLLGPERQGELSGGIASMMGLSAIIGPLALTDTLARYSAPDAELYFPGAAFLLAALLAFLCLVLLLAQLARANAAAKHENAIQAEAHGSARERN
jgi:MFS transporter, DHA1 family, tetracycline resistance protein